MAFKLKLPIEDIVKAYQDEKLSLNLIGTRYDNSSDIIKSRLLSVGIPLRPKKETDELMGRREREWHTKAKAADEIPTIIHALPKKIKQGRNSFPKVRRFEIFARDGFRCRYCGRTPQEDGVKLVVEHIIAK